MASAYAKPANRLISAFRRIYREERLQVRRRGRRKRALGTRAPLTIPQVANQRWSLDFLSDAFADGRRFRILAVVDDFTASAWRAVPTPRCRACAWSLCEAEGDPKFPAGALFLSALRSHEPVETLRAQDVMVHVSYPLTARNGHVEIFNAIVEVRRDAVPEKSWKFIDDIGWR